MILLGVSVDHVATIRQARYRDETSNHGGFIEPDPASLAWLAEEAGLDGITCIFGKIVGTFNWKMCRDIRKR